MRLSAASDADVERVCRAIAKADGFPDGDRWWKPHWWSRKRRAWEWYWGPAGMALAAVAEMERAELEPPAS